MVKAKDLASELGLSADRERLRELKGRAPAAPVDRFVSVSEFWGALHDQEASQARPRASAKAGGGRNVLLVVVAAVLLGLSGCGLDWHARDKAGNEASGWRGIDLVVAELPAGWEAYGAERGERGLPKKIRHGETGIVCVLIPSGRFQMGSPFGEGENDEQPRHLVTITKPFYMAVTETTQGQWEAVMQDNPSWDVGANRPVEWVSWNDAVGFCDQIGARLPTEAEWEYACRAGSEGSYCFGSGDSRLGSYAWYDANSGAGIHDVAGKQPNMWGLHDMHGNVWEWCQDGYRDYSSHGQDDPLVTSGARRDLRVIRGGSFDYGASYCRSAYRKGSRPVFRCGGLGFRVVLAPVLK